MKKITRNIIIWLGIVVFIIMMVLFYVFLLTGYMEDKIVLKSPDGKIKVNFGFSKKFWNGIYYSVEYDNDMIIYPSGMGFKFKDKLLFFKKDDYVSSRTIIKHRGKWRTVYGERTYIQNNYNERKITLHSEFGERNNSIIEMHINIRVYNEGVAFNYFFPYENETFIVQKELSEFSFNKTYLCHATDRGQGLIQKLPINSIEYVAERPIVVEVGSMFVAIGEASLFDFARMKLASSGKNNTLVSRLNKVGAEITFPYTTPWRTIMFGKSPGELLEHNYFVLNLNEPNRIKNTSWIIPGKVFRSMELTTEAGKSAVDFAAKNKCPYIEFDAGWYGDQYDPASSALSPIKELDVRDVIEYGKKKGIGVLLYVNHIHLETHQNDIFPLYQSWGARGVKFGFVNVGTQYWTKWLHESVILASKYELMVNIHDEYRPTGFSRTYPNLLTVEGIHGDEQSPSNEHTLKTLFTRMLVGAGDNTICFLNIRVKEKMGGMVSQLAKSVLLYSPFQFLFWYDQVIQFEKQTYNGMDFFQNLPTVWNETKVIEGEIGVYATIARKNGNDWFLGSLTGTKQRNLRLNLDFLEKNSIYNAKIFSSYSTSGSKDEIKIEEKEVFSGLLLQFIIDQNSGLAIHFKYKGEKIDDQTWFNTTIFFVQNGEGVPMVIIRVFVILIVIFSSLFVWLNFKLKSTLKVKRKIVVKDT